MTLRVAPFSLKLAHLSFSMGPRGPRAYGLRPRLWLLIRLCSVTPPPPFPGTCLRIQIKFLLKLALKVVWTAIKGTFDLLQSSGTLMHDKGLLNAVNSALKSSLMLRQRCQTTTDELIHSWTFWHLIVNCKTTFTNKT